MRGIWIIACHDLLLWRRMPLAIACALIPPVCMTLFLIVLSLSVTRQPVALVVEGKGPHTGRMRQIVESDTDAYALRRTDQRTALRLLRAEQVAAVITIPADFEQQVPRHNAKLLLTLNNIDIDFADDIRRSVDRSVAQFDAPQLSLEGEHGDDETSGAANSYRIAIHERDLRETNVAWLNYQVIPALVLLMLSVGIIGTALQCAQDNERKTARYLALTPQPSWQLLAGRLLGGVLASLLVLAPALGLCAVFRIIAPPASHWPALAAIFLATAMCAAGMGAILGTLLRGSLTIAMAASVVATYMFFLGGGFTTIAFLPPWLRTLSAVIPIRYAIDGMRQALFYSTLDGVLLDITVLLGTACLAIVIGSYAVRRSWA